jgi:hypothetical protein
MSVNYILELIRDLARDGAIQILDERKLRALLEDEHESINQDIQEGTDE